MKEGCYSMNIAETFKYKPLNGDIRLVILGRGSMDDPIRCELFNAKFAAEQEYLALSYEWGSATGKSHQININGLLYDVRKNLFDALRHLRRPNEELILWIDALCINQKNISERNHQVQLMGEIYSQANEVVIWLGLARDNSDLAMSHMEEMDRVVLHDEPRGRLIMKTRKGLEGSEERKNEHLAAIVSWCKRSYWRRMWVIQEIQLAKQLSIHCGAKRLSWSTFRRARECIINWREPFESEKEVYGFMMTSLPARMDELRAKGHTKQIPLVDWLENFKESMCTDPKDKVYAFVGLASDCQNNALAIDYSKSLSQICFDVLKLYFPGQLSAPGCLESHTANVLHLSHSLSRWLRMDSEDGPSIETYDEMRKEQVWIRGGYCGPIVELHRNYEVNLSEKSYAWMRGTETIPITSRSLRNVRPISDGMSFAVIACGWKGYFNDIYRGLLAYVKGSGTGTTRRNQGSRLIGEGLWSMPRHRFPQNVLPLEQAITEYGETTLVPPSTYRDDLICLLPGCDIALIFRIFSGQWTLEGCGIYDYSGRKEMHKEDVHVSLNIRTLQKVTASAEFDHVVHGGSPS